MKKFPLLACACCVALCAQAKGPKWFLNEKLLPEKHIPATCSLDSLVVQQSDGSIRTWAEKEIEWKPLLELVGPKLQSRHVAENLYFSVDGIFYGRLDKIRDIYIDAAYIDARIRESRMPQEKYVRPKYRGRELIKIELRDRQEVRLSQERDRQQREMHDLFYNHKQEKSAKAF